MAEEVSHDDAADRGHRRAGKIGRRIATAIYWIGMVYISIVAFSSVIPQVFWPTVSADALPESTSCQSTVQTLQDELLEYAAHQVRTGANAGGLPPQAFFASFDDRMRTLSDRCDDSQVGTLERLRHRIERTLTRYELDEAELIRALDENDDT